MIASPQSFLSCYYISIVIVGAFLCILLAVVHFLFISFSPAYAVVSSTIGLEKDNIRRRYSSTHISERHSWLLYINLLKHESVRWKDIYVVCNKSFVSPPKIKTNRKIEGILWGCYVYLYYPFVYQVNMYTTEHLYHKYGICLTISLYYMIDSKPHCWQVDPVTWE